MNKKLVVNRLGKSVKIVMAALALLVIAGFIPLQSAHAWSYYGAIGKPGSVQVPVIQVADIGMPTSNGMIPSLTLLANTGPIVYRSPSYAGEQIVYARYRVEQWNGAKWVLYTQSVRFQGRIPANQNAIRFIAPNISPIPTKGIMRFTWAFDWYRPDNVLLGGIFMIPNVASDHKCITTSRPCLMYDGFFVVFGQN